jgi:predicted thioesterase
MRNPFHPGDQKVYSINVDEGRLARFDAGLVHPVYATFALAKDAEWAGRLFVLEMKEEGEEGIGTALSIEHVSPAPVGSVVNITATLIAVEGNRIDVSFEAHVGNRLIARGTTGQKIVNKQRMDALITQLQTILGSEGN